MLICSENRPATQVHGGVFEHEDLGEFSIFVAFSGLNTAIS